MSVEAKLEAWLRSQGGLFPKLRICGAGGYRSVRLTADVAAGEEVAHIPSHCLIAAQASSNALSTGVVDAREEPIVRHIADAGLPVQNLDHVLLAVYMLVDRARQKPRFGAYLAALPTHAQFAHTHPALWEAGARRRRLRGTWAGRCADLLRKEFDEDYEAVLRVSPALADLPGMSAHQFRWARIAVLSRCFQLEVDGAQNGVSNGNIASSDDCSGGGDSNASSAFIAQVPFGDMLNHDRMADVSCRFDHARCALILSARRALFAGEELRGYYGTKSNSAYLAHYGFAIEHNISLLGTRPDVLRVGLSWANVSSPSSSSELCFDIGFGRKMRSALAQLRTCARALVAASIAASDAETDGDYQVTASPPLPPRRSLSASNSTSTSSSASELTAASARTSTHLLQQCAGVGSTILAPELKTELHTLRLLAAVGQKLLSLHECDRQIVLRPRDLERPSEDAEVIGCAVSIQGSCKSERQFATACGTNTSIESESTCHERSDDDCEEHIAGTSNAAVQEQERDAQMLGARYCACVRRSERRIACFIVALAEIGQEVIAPSSAIAQKSMPVASASPTQVPPSLSVADAASAVAARADYPGDISDAAVMHQRLRALEHRVIEFGGSVGAAAVASYLREVVAPLLQRQEPNLVSETQHISRCRATAVASDITSIAQGTSLDTGPAALAHADLARHCLVINILGQCDAGIGLRSLLPGAQLTRESIADQLSMTCGLGSAWRCHWLQPHVSTLCELCVDIAQCQVEIDAILRNGKVKLQVVPKPGSENAASDSVVDATVRWATPDDVKMLIEATEGNGGDACDESLFGNSVTEEVASVADSIQRLVRSTRDQLQSVNSAVATSRNLAARLAALRTSSSKPPAAHNSNNGNRNSDGEQVTLPSPEQSK